MESLLVVARRQQYRVLGFIILTLLAYAAGIGVVLLVNEGLFGFTGFTAWPIAWFLWSVACWPGLAAGVIARWSGAAKPRTLIWLHLANTVFVIGMIEMSYVLASDTPFYITIMIEIVLVYLVISRAKRD